MTEHTVIDQQIVITIAVGSRWNSIWNPRRIAVVTSVDVTDWLVNYETVTQYGDRCGEPTRAHVQYFLSQFHNDHERTDLH